MASCLALALGLVLAPTGASAQSAPLNGVYAPCQSINATPLVHYQASRATRTGSGSTTKPQSVNVFWRAAGPLRALKA